MVHTSDRSPEGTVNRCAVAETATGGPAPVVTSHVHQCMLQAEHPTAMHRCDCGVWFSC